MWLSFELQCPKHPNNIQWGSNPGNKAASRVERFFPSRENSVPPGSVGWGIVMLEKKVP